MYLDELAGLGGELHAEKAGGLRAKGLAIHKIAPAAHDLSYQKAHDHQICHGEELKAPHTPGLETSGRSSTFVSGCSSCANTPPPPRRISTWRSPAWRIIPLLLALMSFVQMPAPGWSRPYCSTMVTARPPRATWAYIPLPSGVK